MAYATLPLNYGPIFPVEADIEPRINVSSFGDGYEQSSGDGINIIRPTTDVVWEGLSLAEVTPVLTFLQNCAGQTPFMWTYPGDAAPSQWVCRKWRRRFIGAGNYGLNATFLRSFNP